MKYSPFGFPFKEYSSIFHSHEISFFAINLDFDVMELQRSDETEIFDSLKILFNELTFNSIHMNDDSVNVFGMTFIMLSFRVKCKLSIFSLIEQTPKSPKRLKLTFIETE